MSGKIESLAPPRTDACDRCEFHSLRRACATLNAGSAAAAVASRHRPPGEHLLPAHGNTPRADTPYAAG